MNVEVGSDRKRRYTVQRIADEIGVKRTTLNGYLHTNHLTASCHRGTRSSAGRAGGGSCR